MQRMPSVEEERVRAQDCIHSDMGGVVCTCSCSVKYYMCVCHFVHYKLIQYAYRLLTFSCNVESRYVHVTSLLPVSKIEHGQ